MVEKPLRDAKSENHSTDIISGSLRPHLSAAVPAMVPPMSRMNSVDGAQSARECAVDREALLNVDDDERKDVEIERIDDPSQEHGPERPPLLAGDLTVPGTLDLGRLNWGRGRLGQ